MTLTIVAIFVAAPLSGAAIASFLIGYAYRVADRRIAKRYPHWNA